jgi:ARG and Rhodanese-Phosphatase-superfamily-associated Protein domain
MKTLKVLLIIAIYFIAIKANGQLVPNVTVENAVYYKNMQVYYLTSNERLVDKEYLSLSEALEKGLVKVYETGNVQELSIKNSSEKYVYINSGDIVKGGQQDRTIRFDMIIPPKSGKIPLYSFCVESGRWQQRGNEDSEEFTENTKVLSSRKLKVAAKYKQDQSSVWSYVAEQQDKLNEKASELKGDKIEVRAGNSESSLQLTLENEDINELIDLYKSGLNKAPTNAIGFAYAINGEIYSIDIYNSTHLFKSYLDKLLESAIVEAISEYSDELLFQNKKSDVHKLISSDQFKLESSEDVNSITIFETYKTDKALKFITKDKSINSKWIHMNYINIDETEITSSSLDQYNIQRQR